MNSLLIETHRILVQNVTVTDDSLIVDLIDEQTSAPFGLVSDAAQPARGTR